MIKLFKKFFAPVLLMMFLSIGTIASASTITLMLGSDTLTASRSVINTNFTNLNTDKAELTVVNTWTVLQKLYGQASTTQISANRAYFGATATTTIDSIGNIVIPSGSGLTNTGRSDGCATWASAILTSTGFACGSGSGGSFPFSTTANYNSTSTAIGFFAGLFSNSSTTINSNLFLPTLSAGSLYVTTSGRVDTKATSTPTVTAPITYSGTLGSFIGGSSGAFACTSASAGVTGCLTGTDWSTFNSKQDTVTVSFPLIKTGAALSFNGLSTSSAAVRGNIPYFSGVNTFANVATSTASCTTGASCSSFTVVGTVAPSITTTLGTSVDLASEVTGNLPVGNLNSGTGASATTFWRGDGTWSSGAGNGDPGFSTSSPYTGGLVLFPRTYNAIHPDFILGASATTSAPFWWDVSATSTYIGNGGLGTSSMSVSGGRASDMWWNFGSYSSSQTGAGNFYIASSSSDNDIVTNQYFTITQTGNVGISSSTPGTLFGFGGSGVGANFTLGTSTFSTTGGINIKSGCFAVNGTCLGAGGGSGTVTSIVAGLGLTGGTITTSGTLGLSSYVATSTAETRSQLAYWTTTNGTPAGLSSVATSTPTVTAPITYSGTLGSFVGGSAGTFACATCSTFGYPFSTTANYNSTSTSIGFFNGLFTTASTTLNNHAYFTDALLGVKGIGIGTTSPVSMLTVVGGAILNAEAKLATTTTMNISMASSTAQLVQIGTSAMTITLTNLYAGQATRITVCNPFAGTAGAITWASTPAGSILWTGGTVPTQTTTAQKCDIWTFTTTQATSTNGTVKAFGSLVPNF